MSRQRLSSAVLAFCVLAVVSACGASTTGGSGDAGSKYTQTWPQSYADTTCAEWLTEMTSAQQFAASADMLSGARDNGDGGTGVAPDDLINAFTGDVTDSCVIPTMKLTDAAVGIYLTERAKYRP